MGEKKQRYVLPLSILIVVSYIFLASRPLTVDPSLSPAWVQELASIEDSGAEDPQALPFATETHFGYISPDGKLLMCRKHEERLSIAPFAWASYEARSNTAEINLRESNRTLVSSLPGYPWLADERVWILAPEQNGISLLDNEGKALWTRFFTSPITTLDAANGILLVGLLEGRIIALGQENNILFEFTPGASRIEAIYGAILSPDARYMAIASGLDRQRILLLERSAASWKVVWHRYTDTDFRRPVKLYFLDGGALLLHEDVGGVSIVDTMRRKTKLIPLEGSVLSVCDTEGDRIIYILSATEQRGRELTGIRAGSTIFHRSRWQSDAVFLARSGSYLILGGKDALAGIYLEHK